MVHHSQTGIRLVFDQCIPRYLPWRCSRLAGWQVVAVVEDRQHNWLGRTSRPIQNPTARILLRSSLQPLASSGPVRACWWTRFLSAETPDCQRDLGWSTWAPPVALGWCSSGMVRGSLAGKGCVEPASVSALTPVGLPLLSHLPAAGSDFIFLQSAFLCPFFRQFMHSPSNLLAAFPSLSFPLPPSWTCICHLCHLCTCRVVSHCHRLAVPVWRSHALQQFALHSGLSTFCALFCNWWSRHAVPCTLTIDRCSNRCAISDLGVPCFQKQFRAW